jgi:hypothetical protein
VLLLSFAVVVFAEQRRLEYLSPSQDDDGDDELNDVELLRLESW